jgi:hypothetical protein
LKHSHVNSTNQFYITKFDTFDNKFYFFYVLPFIFYFSFQIDEKSFCSDNNNPNVNINSISRTNICEDIILVMFNQYYVRLYSLNWIKESSQVLNLNEKNIHSRKFECDYGLDQNGLPLDYILKKQPPILLQIQCFNHVLSIGSTPIHVLYADVKKKNKLLVYNVENQQLTGGFELDDTIIERDQVEFHPQNDGSIINFSQNELR